ncbi:MAG TPA: amidohydrolase family protein, partial [Myxococcaceae bacterium]|nr:amidohydrolase family protein [Myxococcaceae bacterium]
MHGATSPRRFALFAVFLSAFGCRSSRPPRIDVHTHIAPEAVPRAIELMDRYGIASAVNLSGGVPGRGLEEQLKAASRYPGRIVVFAGLDWYEPSRGKGYGGRMAASLMRSRELGAAGLEIPRGLGIGFRDDNGALIGIDEPELDPVFDKAAELGMPVAIHAGAPVAFWLAPIARNERYEELKANPGLSLYGEAPPWETLFLQLERRIARHPNCTFISVHFGNAAEYPARVAALLAKYPNLYIDTAGRIPELGRHPAGEIRKLFLEHADRILFGSDLWLGREASDVVLSSRAKAPPTREDFDRFFNASWRYFETADRNFPHPTPIQGNWKISGIDLPSGVLQKLYAANAKAVL